MTHSSKSIPEPRGVLSFAGEMVAGASYPIRAITILLPRLHLMGYVVVPVLVNLVVGAVLYAGLLMVGLQGIENLLAGLPEWAVVLDIVLRALLIVALLIVIGFLLLRFGVVLGAPWYSRLAEALEQMSLGNRLAAPSPGLTTIGRDLWHALVFEFGKLLLFVGVGLPLLLLNLIPVVGSVLVMIGSIALTATIVCLDFFDASLSRRYVRFRRKLTIVFRALPASAGFGLISLVLVSVPFLNLLVIPVCMAGGTLFFCDRIWEREFPDERAAASDNN